MGLEGGPSPRNTGLLLRLADVRPVSIIEQASERFRTSYPERALIVESSETLSSIHVDATLFRRVIDNLLGLTLHDASWRPTVANIELSSQPGGGTRASVRVVASAAA
jgi:K+-sensing histidine kinase KdpD